VNPLPTVTASSSAASVCAGNSVTLNGGGAATYAWTGGATNNTPFVPTATTTYTVTGTDANGCTNTANTTVTIDALPTVTASSSAASVCAGNSVTLNGGGAATYTWTGGATNNTPFVPTATATYTVTGTDANGCTNTANTTVTVNALPTVTASSSAASVCAGNSVTLNGGGAATYTWTGGATNNTPFVPASTATYTVTGTAANGCTNTANITVTVNALPIVNFVPLNPDTLCLNASPVSLMGGAPSGGIYAGPGVNNGNFDPSVAGVGTHQLTYTYTDVNGCENSASTSVGVEVCAGVGSAIALEISVYPNPSAGTFNFLAQEDVLEIKVYDGFGRLIVQQSDLGTAFQLDLANYAAGYYFVQLFTPTGSMAKRLHKM
jgi:Secretion system C-terminal sorting domain